MTTMTNWTPDKIAELVDRGRGMANGPEPHGYDYAVFIGILVDALEATTDTIVASQGRIAELEMQIDPPICRLQFPDGSVPGNAREAAEGWRERYNVAVAERDSARRGTEFAVSKANEYSQAADDWRRRAKSAEARLDEIRLVVDSARHRVCNAPEPNLATPLQHPWEEAR